MKRSGLAAAWVASVVVLVAALAWSITQWYSLGQLGAAAGAEHARLAAELESQRQGMRAELAQSADVVRELRWSPDRVAAAEVIRRLADLARDAQTKVLAVSALERESTPRYRKVWHRIEMSAPFRDLVEFAVKVERAGGILEDVVVDVQRGDAATAGQPGGARDVHAQFRLTAVEPSDEARRIIDRALAAARNSPPIAAMAPLAVPAVPRSPAAVTVLRDPFQVSVPPRPAPAKGAAPGKPVVAALPPVPAAPMFLKGIVKFPGGAMAIVNGQLVKAGDVIDGHRVKAITDGKVVLGEPGGGSRELALPAFATVVPKP